jgi:hypothetical protein
MLISKTQSLGREDGEWMDERRIVNRYRVQLEKRNNF